MSKKEWRVNAIALLVLVLLLVAGSYTTLLISQAENNRKDFLVREILDAQASAIERRLYAALNAARFIGIEVSIRGGSDVDFSTMAERALAFTPGITNLQLAPGGVIREIYPLAGNERALGLDLLQGARADGDAQRALRQRRMVISGPFELVQGGSAIVGREPVFVAGEFWGFSSVLIRLDDLARLTGLNKLRQKGYRFRLSTQDVSARTVLATLDDAQLLQPRFLKSHDINLPGNNKWLLQVMPPLDRAMPLVVTGGLATLMVAVLAALLLRRLLLAPLRLQSQVDEQIRLLEHMHNHDVLTGLPNRSFIFEHLDFICSECDAHNCMAALMVVNIDGFKRINDLHGHRSGDHVLKEIALRIRQSCSPSDVVARIGADEFAVVVADIKDYRAISALAKTTLTALQEPLKVRKSTISVTACVGIVVLPIDAISAAEALQKSDSAVDEAKSQGISQFSFFNAQQQRQAIEKMQLEEQLAQAAERDEYVLHFQPIVKLRRDVASTTTAAPEDADSLGFEALIRWQSADRGLLFPDQFIDAAENSGAIVALGYWVVEAACLQLLQCGEGCWISVNLSPKQLAAPELVGNIAGILERTGVDAKRLTVEVTESCFIRDVTVAISTLRKLKKLGLNIALDDFGTGFSSLSLLQKLPVDKLKIDRSFIEKLQQDDRDRQIVHGLILIAHKLGLEVIAEGVEQGEHEDILKQMQCDYGQGYFYSKPAAAEEINHWRQQYRSA